MLEKSEVVDLIEVTASGVVQVRICVNVSEGETLLSSQYKRYCIEPGSDYAGEPQRVIDICSVIHTPEVVAAYELEREQTITD